MGWEGCKRVVENVGTVNRCIDVGYEDVGDIVEVTEVDGPP